ncbi:hypothetical protein M404DRAFT_995481 [Pisolithus tinctorius Marx 270]|uniref:Uncharacterized protein n=1 Tax=Pisolithus tinctorius Marx 270 TaxID=870435 RepID=A0A0C3KL11_PISTI|nr:hypothetical protein M404DRAFT_995481 [Pisolithus tinctorius Marx 270]
MDASTWHDIVFFDWEKTAPCKLERIEHCKELQEKLHEFLALHTSYSLPSRPSMRQPSQTLKWKRTSQYLRVVPASQRENLKIWLTNAYGKYEVFCALEDTPSASPSLLRSSNSQPFFSSSTDIAWITISTCTAATVVCT